MANKSYKSKQNHNSKQSQQIKQPEQEKQPEQINQSEQTKQPEQSQQSEQTKQPEQSQQSEQTKQPEKEKQPEQPAFDYNKVIEFLKKYRNYIAAGILFILMVVILVKCTGPAKVTEEEKPQVESEKAEDPLAEEFAVDAIPEVNQLISSYYNAYANGDVDELSKLADPISDTEKSYIQLFSEYVESYDNLVCYTKSGLAEGEYVVSVYLDMKFKNIATAAPGLDFFYIRTNETGKLYIDNAYSQFNQSNMEASTQADVQTMINEFEQEDDVVALQQEVQQKYEAAVGADADLNKMATETIPNVIATWVQSLSDATEQPEQPKEDEDKGEETKPEEEPKEEEASDEETKPKDTSDETKKKTAYAMDTVNVRKGPSTDKSVVTQIEPGDKITIYPDTLKDGWIKVKVGKKKGYVKREFITTKKSKVPSSSEPSSTPTALPEGKSISLSESVNVRASMSESADRVGLAYQGDTVKVIQSYEEGWTKVEWNGQTGYIKTELIK